jgi:hypothetical protein
MGKSTISMAIFNSQLLVYQRVPKNNHKIRLQSDRVPCGSHSVLEGIGVSMEQLW